MKRFLITLGVAALALPLFAQQKAPASPPEKTTATISGKTVEISYSSPRVRGREGHIFTKDGLLSHDAHYPVWRAGANAATTLHTDADLTIGTLAVPKGDYTLFVDVSNPDRWFLIVNKQTKQWGLQYNSAHDLGKVPMAMTKPESMVEDLTWAITKNGGNKGQITLSWENYVATVPFVAH